MKDKLIEKFRSYAETYDMSDENIARKYFHSIRVMEFAEHIAESLKLNQYHIKLAIIAGLLHDYGRFEQWIKYHTYSDVVSIDHGDLGVKLLFEQNEIVNFHDETDDFKSLFYAIKIHNKLEIPPDLDEKYVPLCKIVRDADKLDIFNLLIKQKSLSVEDNCLVSEKVKNDFFTKKKIDYHDVKTKNDKIVLLLALFYDLNFDYSLDYARKNHLLDQLYNSLNHREELNPYFSELREYLLSNIVE